MEGEFQTRDVQFYNLDAIISVGYRVNSRKATAFRQWATSVLKQYMLKGYAVNHNAVSEQKYEDLKRALGLLENVFGQNLIMAEQQAKELFAVVKDYTYALDTLDAYDYQNLEISDTTLQEKFRATYESAMEAIRSLKEKFKESQLFGVEKDKSFHSSIGQIYQTWDGQELYPSVEEKAAMLLYLVVKNHSFIDGNKRIAATLFLWFLQNNGILYRPDGTKRIADGTLVALTLMIAESRMDEMDILVKVVVNLINRKQ
jgi:prophage maintenance system killer protein